MTKEEQEAKEKEAQEAKAAEEAKQAAAQKAADTKVNPPTDKDKASERIAAIEAKLADLAKPGQKPTPLEQNEVKTLSAEVKELKQVFEQDRTDRINAMRRETVMEIVKQNPILFDEKTDEFFFDIGGTPEQIRASAARQIKLLERAPKGNLSDYENNGRPMRGQPIELTEEQFAEEMKKARENGDGKRVFALLASKKRRTLQPAMQR